MIDATQNPQLKMINTPQGLLIHGRLHGIQELDTDIQEQEITLRGAGNHAHLQQTIPLPKTIDTTHSIVTFADQQLRMVLPWRSEQ